MRAELNILEQLESYAMGTMSSQEAAAFEVELNNSPELQSMLEMQVTAMQAAKRSALRSEILAVAATSGAVSGGGSTLLKTWLWFALGGIITIGTIIGILWNSDNEPKHSPSLIESESTLDSEPVDIDSANTQPLTPSEIERDGEELQDSLAMESFSPEQLPEIRDVDTKGNSRDESWIFAEGQENLFAMLNTNNQFRIESGTNINDNTALDYQRFIVSGAYGGTIRGKKGTLIIVPEGAFVSTKGKKVEGPINIELYEEQATNGNQLIIEAYAEGKPVRINPKRPIYLELANDNSANRLIWNGATKRSSQWIKARSSENFLTEVSPTLLEFTPYEATNAILKTYPSLGIKNPTRRAIDSIYYGLQNQSDFVYSSATEDEFDLTQLPQYSPALANNPEVKKMTPTCAIQPATMMVLRSSAFTGTYVFTLEFEKRVQAMHKMAKGQVYLNTYIEHLDGDMYIADSINMMMADDGDQQIFEAFYAERATKVKHTLYTNQLRKLLEENQTKQLAQLERSREQIQAFKPKRKWALTAGMRMRGLTKRQSKKFRKNAYLDILHAIDNCGGTESIKTSGGKNREFTEHSVM